jgi:hypothetical protein
MYLEMDLTGSPTIHWQIGRTIFLQPWPLEYIPTPGLWCYLLVNKSNLVSFNIPIKFWSETGRRMRMAGQYLGAADQRGCRG